MDVKQEEGSNLSALDASLDHVDHTKDSIRRCVIVMGSELSGGKKMETGSIKENPFGDDPLQEFTTALEEGDGSVRLRHPVIYFTGFGNGDHSCRTPGVVSKAYRGVENEGEACRGGGVAPL